MTAQEVEKLKAVGKYPKYEDTRPRQDGLHEVERVRDLVRDVLDARVFPIALRDGVDERVVVVDLAPRRQLDDDDVVVDRPHVPQHFAEFVHLPVLLRDEVEEVGVEAEARRRRDGDDGHDGGDSDNAAAPAETEAGQRFEELVGQREGS